MRLAQLHFPEFPVPLGVYYQHERDTLTFKKTEQFKTTADLQALYRAKAAWTQ